MSQRPDDRSQNKPRAKAAAARDETQAHTPRAGETVDWRTWWSLSIAVSALLMAGLVYFNEGDTVGASVIMAGAAGIVALVLLFSEAPYER